MKKLILNLALGFFSIAVFAGNSISTPIQPNEKWWGAAVGLSEKMPFSSDLLPIDLSKDNYQNQSAAFLISNHGRYIWSSNAFEFQIENNLLKLTYTKDSLKITNGGKNLKEAYNCACTKSFSPNGKMPASVFFTKPQYNTWIELMYNQNQNDVLNYANKILANGLAPGVLMIDDNWQKQYGNFEFRPDKFQNPKEMVAELHKKGFYVMLWISPFVSPDGAEYRSLKRKGFLIHDMTRKQPAIFDWWNGQSAAFDLSNPAAYDYLKNVLKKMQSDFGIDGFKFDAGDIRHYQTANFVAFDQKSTPADHSELWAKLGAEFEFNEFRACWKGQGKPLVQRLSDKKYSWGDLNKLIPAMLTAGIMGYPYICPDMIGGGEFSSFLNVDPSKFDQELIVRSAQIHALAPMMQFSVAPWRVLDKEHADIVYKAAQLHVQFGDYILELAKQAAKTGEPIIRMMEYVFPNQGLALCRDQFMLGDKFLVAPMTARGTERTVHLPKGNWRDDQGKKVKGGTSIKIEVPLNRLAWYEKLE